MTKNDEKTTVGRLKSRPQFLFVREGEKRKGPWLENNPKIFNKTASANGWYLIDVYGNPYAYFASIGGKLNNYQYKINPTPMAPPLFADQSYSVTTLAGASTVAPYQSSAGKYINENGFQLISARP